jgi:hypothetical protein
MIACFTCHVTTPMRTRTGRAEGWGPVPGLPSPVIRPQSSSTR